MARVFISLQTPDVEMQIKSAADCSGKTDRLFAGFKRHPSDIADQRIKEFETILNDKETPTETRVVNMRNFLKEEILYLRDVTLFVQAEGASKLTKRVVADTRAVKDDEELWGDASNCLDFLLDLLLATTPWSSPFTTAFYAVSTNMTLGEDASGKNF